jgi:hypothetical protein
VRHTLLAVAGTLTAAILLSACSGGGVGSSSVPGGGSATSMGHKQQMMKVTMVGHNSLTCPYSKYLFCIGVTPSNSGPYVQWSACTTYSCPSYYDLVAVGALTKVKGKAIKSKKVEQSWSPSPGNPTYQYIVEHKKQKANSKKVKAVDATSACYYYFPSVCSYTYYIGIFWQ